MEATTLQHNCHDLNMLILRSGVLLHVTNDWTIRAKKKRNKTFVGFSVEQRVISNWQKRGTGTYSRLPPRPIAVPARSPTAVPNHAEEWAPELESFGAVVESRLEGVGLPGWRGFEQ